MSIKYYIDVKDYRIKPTKRFFYTSGWAFSTDNAPVEFECKINGQNVQAHINIIDRKDVAKKYSKYNLKNVGFSIKIPLEKDFNLNSFELKIITKTESKTILNLDEKGIKKITHIDDSLYHFIEGTYIYEKKITITGWAVSELGNENIKFSLKDQFENNIDFKIHHQIRKDLLDFDLVDENNCNCGFVIEFPRDKNISNYTFTFLDDYSSRNINLDIKKIYSKQKRHAHISFIRLAIKHIKLSALKKVLSYIYKNGFRGLFKYIVNHINSAGKPYSEWYIENKPTNEELLKQKETHFDYQPLISIIVPTYKTPIIYLREMIESVINQTYTNWELCIADGSEGDQAVEQELEKYSQIDSRIKYTILEKNLGIADNTNEALKLATGEYVGLFDHDDLLAPNALFEVVKSLQEDDYDIIYTDEDKITGDVKKHMDPNFKPDFSIDLFRSHNYITHFFVVKTSIINKIGGFRREYDGSQDYDLMFRCIENSTKIKHIPMILYHWRIHMNSVAGDPSSKMYAYEAGKKAIEDHLKRMNIDATVDHVGLWGMYHVQYAIHNNPLVSIIIPNKDHIKDLNTCITSIYKNSEYKDFEIIIVENNSTEEDTFKYYERIQEQYNNLKVVVWDKEFNYSLINNYGVQYAQGEYLLFLNNDTELISSEAISEMLGCCMREEVGAVGAKLLYEDNTVQHAGVVIGFDNYAGHVNTGIGRDDYGYMVRARINCNYSAVTAACLMTKKSLFNQVGGFDEQFVVACNDVDYCLKLRSINKLIVFNAFAEWYHYESKSRGYDDSGEKAERFELEKAKFKKKWQKVLDEGDPFYNKNFPINRAPFTLG